MINKDQPFLNVDLSVTEQFDHVFLFGDTNYRINADRPFVFDTLRKGDYQVKGFCVELGSRTRNSCQKILN